MSLSWPYASSSLLSDHSLFFSYIIMFRNVFCSDVGLRLDIMFIFLVAAYQILRPSTILFHGGAHVMVELMPGSGLRVPLDTYTSLDLNDQACTIKVIIRFLFISFSNVSSATKVSVSEINVFVGGCCA